MVKLSTALSELEELHRLTQGRGGAVKIDKDLLSRLLTDHHAAIGALRSNGIKITEKE